VLAARGVSGIDGTVSLAVGAALAHDGPAYALLGDLTFLHDAGGLHVGTAEPVPDLTLVVADDVGGGIFTVLEQGAAEYADAFERMFATPHRADLAALCAAYGVAYRRVTALAELDDALGATGSRGLRVVHVPIDRTGRRAASARADAALREALITAR
jgi:2-succinyl-5-enolpyruvyl-6-hydroxy-3-cyclohexene-1-carboxylate synthase